MIKITKFGGSSVANAQQFAKVKNIIESDPARRFVVVSAVGRANKQDNKVTDLLYLCQAHMQYHVPQPWRRSQDCGYCNGGITLSDVYPGYYLRRFPESDYSRRGELHCNPTSWRIYCRI